MIAKFNARLPESLEPGAEETRRLLSFREHAPACSDISFHLQFSGPGTQSIRPKLRQQIVPSFRFRPIVGGKIFHRFAVGEIEPTPAGDEKFLPADARPSQTTTRAPRTAATSAARKPAGPAPTTTSVFPPTISFP